MRMVPFGEIIKDEIGDEHAVRCYVNTDHITMVQECLGNVDATIIRFVDGEGVIVNDDISSVIHKLIDESSWFS